MADEKPIYARGTPVKVRDTTFDVITRYNVPMFLVAAARGTFLIKSDYDGMLDHTIALLNGAAQPFVR